MESQNNGPKLKLTIAETNYYINEQRGSVTCKIKAFINCPTAGLSNVIWLDNKGENRAALFTSTATAHLSEGDIFDRLAGQRIAEAKAQRKLYREVNAFIKNQITPEMLENAKAVVSFSERLTAMTKHENDRVIELCNPTSGE